MECQQDGKDGFKWGSSGTCYVHDSSDAGKAEAKRKAVKQAIAANGGKAPRNLEGVDASLIVELEREYAALETVDLDSIEILSTGGPVHGVGSPPEGDHWSPEDLSAIAAANRELADELRPPSRIGHERDGRMPAVGHLENIRTSDDGSKLVADLKAVPRKFADLVKARGYRARSVELAKVTSQKSGKTYDWAVTGLAWLGAKLPAVRTLDDVVALYEEGDGVERRFVQVDEQELAELDVERLLESLHDLVAVNGWLVTEKNVAAADTRPAMPEKVTYTDEHRRKFAEATGLEAEKVTDEMLTAAGVAGETPEPAEPVKPREGDQARALEQAIAKADQADERVRKLEEELRVERRRMFVEDVLRTGKAEPGQRAEIETLFDKDAAAAVKFFESVKANEQLGREYGSDEDGDEGSEEAAEKAYAAHFERTFGREYALGAGVIES